MHQLCHCTFLLCGKQPGTKNKCSWFKCPSLVHFELHSCCCLDSDVSDPLAVAEMLSAWTEELLELRWGLVCLGWVRIIALAIGTTSEGSRGVWEWGERGLDSPAGSPAVFSCWGAAGTTRGRLWLLVSLLMCVQVSTPQICTQSCIQSPLVEDNSFSHCKERWNDLWKLSTSPSVCPPSFSTFDFFRSNKAFYLLGALSLSWW